MLKQVLLGIIALYGPQSGYDLHHTIIKNRRPRLPRIYVALKEMVQEKLVEYDRIHSDSGPTRNIYRITPEGYEAVRLWLSEKDIIQPVHEPLMPKIWFARIGDKNAIVDNLTNFNDHRKAEIVFYKKLRKIYADRKKTKRVSENPLDAYYAVLSLEYMISRAEADIKWAKGVMQDIVDLNNNNDDASVSYTPNIIIKKKTK